MSLWHESRGIGPDLVLLHGWGLNAAVWSTIVAALEDSYCVHVLELPGHGNSPYAGECSIEEWAQACLDVVPKQAIWIGWSLGAQVALQAALLSPQRVARLIITAGSPRFVQAPDWPNAMPLGTLGEFAEALSRDYKATINRFLALQVRGSEGGRELLRALKLDLAARPDAHPKALEVGLRLLRETDLREGLKDLRCPLLALLGERDQLVPIQLAEDLIELAPSMQIARLTGAGHAPFLSHSDQWLTQVNRFIQ